MYIVVAIIINTTVMKNIIYDMICHAGGRRRGAVERQTGARHVRLAGYHFTY